MKKKSTNKIKNIIIILLAIVVVVLLITSSNSSTTVINKENPSTPKTTPVVTTTPISIATQNITETNFTGKKPVISGSGSLATAANTYIDQTIADFKTEADKDVPDMIKKFGAGSPPATYEIDIDAKDIKGAHTESIVINTYAYTGGANGDSSYKVITTSLSTGQVLSLSDIIKPTQQATFTAYLKKQLNTWKPEGSTTPVVFPDSVNTLTFSSFTNWSLDGKNLIIYFDKDEIGPGVLGAVAFPLPIITIKDFMVSNFI